jgi:hypothetical protein
MPRETTEAAEGFEADILKNIGFEDEPADDTDFEEPTGELEEPAQEQYEPPQEEVQEQELPTLKADARDNLIDGEGKVVVPAGLARRFYERARKEQQRTRVEQSRANQLQTYLEKAVQVGQQLNERVRALQDAGNLGTKFNLSNEEQVQALQFMSDYKRNPTEALKAILTRAAAYGTKLDELGLGGGLDANSLVTAIEEKLGGKLKAVDEMVNTNRERETEAARQEQLQRDTTREVVTFLQQNPDARAHLNTLKQILGKFPQLGLTEAWLRLKLYLAGSHGERTADPQRRSRPNGRAPGERPTGGVAPLETDYGKIINEELDRIGLGKG